MIHPAFKHLPRDGIIEAVRPPFHLFLKLPRGPGG
jgi:hypothetical protein